MKEPMQSSLESGVVPQRRVRRGEEILRGVLVGGLSLAVLGGFGHQAEAGSNFEQENSPGHSGPRESSLKLDHRQNVKVQLQQGKLRGVRRAGVDRFLGVPYAQPPVGDLRWRPPQAAEPWEGTLHAEAAPPQCLQANGEGQEDCLYLSVLRPSRSRNRGTLPVLVFLHGGGFRAGSGLDNDPTRLVQDTNTIAVMLNSRLAMMGFLAHPELTAETADQSSGQYGLLDQQMALRWVQENIAEFGGDPSRVTIAGGSSGAYSVCAQVASPQNVGLFSRAVMMSGACWSVEQEIAESVGADFALELGCSNGNSLECLRNKTPEELMLADLFGVGGIILGGDFLPESPFDTIATGQGNNVPLMIGGAEHETRGGRRMRFPLSVDDYAASATTLFGDNAEAVLEQYPPEAYDDPFYAESDAVSDGLLTHGPCSNRRVAQAMSPYAPVYVYEFADSDAPLPVWVAANAPPGFKAGATHTSDEVYWWDRPQDGIAPGTRSQWALADQMIDMLGRFARWGAPTHHRSRAPWPAYTPADEQVLRLIPDATAPVNDWASRHNCDFWATLSQ